MPKSPGRAAFIPVLYGGVALLLLILGVFAHGFTRNIGDARIAGRYATLPLFQSHAVRDLTLSWNGLALRFSAATTPSLQSIEPTTDGGTDIVFDGDVRLHIAPGRDTNGSVSLATVPGAAKAASLVVPFSVAGVLLTPSPEAALAWNRAGHVYQLTLPASAQVDAGAQTIALPLDGSAWTAGMKLAGTTAVAAAAPVARPAASTAAKAPDENAMPGESDLATTLSQFVDKAYAGWSQTRVASSGLWKLPDGTPGFSEDIGIGLLAESIARGTWQSMYPLWSNAIATQQAANPGLALTTSTYAGGVRTYVSALQTRSSAQIEALRPLIAASDAKALATPHLITLVADHGDAALLQACLAFITSRPVASLDAATAVGLLDSLLDDAAINGGNETLAKTIKDVADKKILPSLRATDAGVFLETSTGLVDVKTSVRAGALLLSAGALLSDTRLAAYGRGLVSAGLALGDEQGIMPATLSLASSKVGKRDGALGPESLYALLPIDRRVAREIPLTRRLGQGSWIWTSARVVTAETTTAQTTLVLGYPAGIAHNVVIQGIRPFSLVKLHGIAWHTDPTYYKYSDGWSYDATTRTFYLKVTGKSDQEEIDIIY